MLFLPLFSASINTILLLNNNQTPKAVFQFFALSSVTLSAICALVLLYFNLHGELVSTTLFTFLHVGNFIIPFALNADTLALQMALVITVVGWLIHLYADSYMVLEQGYTRFFIFFNLFMFFMLLLVLAANPFLLYIGWEGVGLCSFALIGFYIQKRSNIFAANKAFIANRVGDFALLCALLLLWKYTPGTDFSFSAILAHISTLSTTQSTLIAVLLFIAMTGKSAQIPLYVWLPDAMAGPTPVSALIHAATMVTAGVYLLARFFELYAMVPLVLQGIGYVAALSSLLAALIALRQNDIKKILAYSTMSQLGYMFMALSAQMPSYAMFHLYTHAFFKALLFMGAGAIIVAMHHEQDIRKLAISPKQMPLLYALMLIATLTISGMPPLSGFFSKDGIMLALFASHSYGIFAIALTTALLTALYMFRLFFMLFHQRTKSTLRPSTLSMGFYAPMIVLALFSIFNGWLNLPHIFGGHELFSSWLLFDEPKSYAMHLALSTEALLLFINISVALLGIWLAYQWYVKKVALSLPTRITSLIEQKFYIDELYTLLFITPLYQLSRWLDKNINTKFIDQSINGSAFLYAQAGAYFRLLFSGSTRFYLLIITASSSLMFVYIIFYLEYHA